MPAQLTRISQRPSVAATSWASAATEASEETSHLQAIALRPAFCTSATVSAPDAMSAMTMSAPSCARRCANACPMPAAAPEMTAILLWWDGGMGRGPFVLMRCGQCVGR